MEGVPYVDGLVREYLLFRGCAGALGALEAELAGDAGRAALRADRLAGLVLGELVAGLRARRLRSLWAFLQARVFAQLDAGLQAAAREVWGRVQRRYLVHAAESGRRDAVQEFLELEGPALLRADPQAWGPWFALAFLRDPAAEPQLAPFFAPEWAAALEEALRNLFATAFARLPLPTLLGFAAARAEEEDRRAELEELRAENLRLRAALERDRRRGGEQPGCGRGGRAGGRGAPELRPRGTPAVPGSPGLREPGRQRGGGCRAAPSPGERDARLHGEEPGQRRGAPGLRGLPPGLPVAHVGRLAPAQQRWEPRELGAAGVAGGGRGAALRGSWAGVAGRHRAAAVFGRSAGGVLRARVAGARVRLLPGRLQRG